MTELLTIICDEPNCTELDIKGEYYRIVGFCNNPSYNNTEYHICKTHSLGSFVNRMNTVKKYTNFTVYFLNR